MRIVIIATGSWGDVRPNVVLGQELQRAGYNVLLVAEEPFRKWVAGRGVAFAGLTFNTQVALDAQSKSSNLLQTMNWIRKAAQATMQMVREIADVIQDGDTVLLNEGILALVNGVVEKRRCQVIHINLQPWVPTAEFSGMTLELPAWIPFKRSAYNHWAGGMARRTQWWVMGRSGNQIRTRYLRLPKQTWNRHHAMLDATPSLLLASPHVIKRPSDWPPHHHITGYLFDDENDWAAPQDLLDFLADGNKPVYIGLGSMRERDPQATTQIFLEAVARTGQRAILLSGWAGIGSACLPKNVFVLKYAPHNWLFPRMAAVVHHGGAGTTAATLRAGVPSVVVPIMSDQPFWGRLVYELQAGTNPIPRSILTSDNLAAAILEATTNRTIQEKAMDSERKFHQKMEQATLCR
jgi:sterol 3beta-glucosyltransferase